MKLQKIMLGLLLIVMPVCAFGMDDEHSNLPPEPTPVGIAVATIKDYLERHPEIEFAGVASVSIVLGAVVGKNKSAWVGVGTTLASLCAYGSYRVLQFKEDFDQ